MSDAENVVVSVVSTPVVQDRVEVQMSDGGAGDWGENKDK
jgi:hypothetical protein